MDMHTEQDSSLRREHECALKAVRENPMSWRGRTRSVAEREYSLAAQAERYRSLFEVVAAS